MTNRTTLTCKVISQENWGSETVGFNVKIINPFGRRTGRSDGKDGNDPKNMMVMIWHPNNPAKMGATYTFDHRYSPQYPKEVEMEYLMLGLANEVGEVLGKYKKYSCDR